MNVDGDRWRTDVDHSRDPIFAVAGAIGAAVGGILSAFVVTALVSLAIQLLSGSLPPVPRFGLVFVAGAVGLAGAAGGYLAFRGFRIFDYVGISRPSTHDLLWAVGGYLLAIGLVFVAGFVLSALQIRPDTANRAAVAGMENPAILLWLVPLSFLVIAPAEEFLFRGVVQGRLREAFRPSVAIPLTAALFATVHYFSLTGGSGARLTAIMILFLPSLVFGLAYERTRNIVVSMLIHGAYNSTLALLFFVVMQSMQAPPVPV